MAVEQFGVVNKVNLTILVDNRADLIVKSNQGVKYFTDKALLAEHGFSALVHFWEADSGREVKVLWDAGVTQVTLMENLRRMEIDPQTVDQIALSHGHHDHYAALTDFLTAMDLQVESREWPEPLVSARVDAWLASRRVPLIAHPAAFRERWRTKKDGTRVGPISPPPWLVWEALGADIQYSEDPYPLGSGCWTSGYIPRRSFEQIGRPSNLFYRQGDQLIPDDLEEDQAIVLHVKGKGLVILSGCAHAGILNTIEQAREISGVERVHAIIGGFHLARSDSVEIDKTITAIQAMEPAVLVPCHCTGFQAMCAFARKMPEAFIPGVVGATYMF